MYEVPEPTRCPECRQQLRSLHVNQLNLFARKCSATGSRMVTHYPPDVPFPVYSQPHWYSDEVDNTRLGVPFDFNRPFFEQFAELARRVPRPALFTDFLRDENSAYTNYAGKNRDCYMILDSDENRSSLYSYSLNSCTNAADCYRGDTLEQCIECVDSQKCYGSCYLFNCEGCSSSAFLSNCISCTNCLFCSNLRHKQYHVFNRPVTPAEFERIRGQLGNATQLKALSVEFERFCDGFPQRYQRGFQNEDCTGSYLLQCKDAYHCFDCRELRDGRYCFQTFMKVVSAMDIDQCGEAELLYECSNLGYNAYNVKFSMNCLNQVRDLTYCDMCFNGSSELFGCIGLKRKSHCILNRQYSEPEYFALKARIIEHMRLTGEWGHFFPAWLSPFGYNLTVASGFFPLTQREASAKGFRWHQPESRDPAVEAASPPDSISESSDELCSRTFSCGSCSRPYKFIPQEIGLYQRLGVALPSNCFACRHQRRLNGRTPRQLWWQQCAACDLPLVAPYEPSRGTKVLCERCYVESLD